MEALSNSRSRVVGILIALVACAAISAGPAAAQSEDESQPVEIQVYDVHVPPTLAKLRAQGILVKASCSRDCLMAVGVKVSAAMAAKLGLRTRLVAFGARFAAADRIVTVRMRVRRKAMEALERNEGGHFSLVVRGKDCSAGCVL